MELYLIRHGLAQQLGLKNDFTDEKRTLTSEGRDRMREVARGLRKLGVQLDLLLTSPLVRATETAEIVADALGISKKEIVQTDNLAPGASVDQLFAEIKSHTGVESVGLVGHQPDLGEMLAKIVQANNKSSIDLKKGSACCINVVETVPSLHGQLVWLMTPKQLRLLARG
ncbi:MAG TPA: phosphohistidine phosphatase SixA [Blastocatellia bacterium]|nr:phosphohistidine phosphatase SixA [Blastocatellia bacterium]